MWLSGHLPWLRYERMAAQPTKTYGSGIVSNYLGQGRALAKQFQATN